MFKNNVWLINVFATQQFSQFSMANISFKIACRELKIAQIAHWVNQLFQLLNLVRLYGYRHLWVESDAIEEK